MTLEGVRRFRIQASAIVETVEAIRSAGQDGYELFAIWSGTCDDDVFKVAKVHIPRQISYQLDAGLCVRIDGAELHRLNVWLYEAQQVIGVQVHSHPLMPITPKPTIPTRSPHWTAAYPSCFPYSAATAGSQLASPPTASGKTGGSK